MAYKTIVEDNIDILVGRRRPRRQRYRHLAAWPLVIKPAFCSMPAATFPVGRYALSIRAQIYRKLQRHHLHYYSG
jgi:hypothetical protein